MYDATSAQCLRSTIVYVSNKRPKANVEGGTQIRQAMPTPLESRSQMHPSIRMEHFRTKTTTKRGERQGEKTPQTRCYPLVTCRIHSLSEQRRTKKNAFAMPCLLRANGKSKKVDNNQIRAVHATTPGPSTLPFVPIHDHEHDRT